MPFLSAQRDQFLSFSIQTLSKKLLFCLSHFSTPPCILSKSSRYHLMARKPLDRHCLRRARKIFWLCYFIWYQNWTWHWSAPSLDGGDLIKRGYSSHSRNGIVTTGSRFVFSMERADSSAQWHTDCPKWTSFTRRDLMRLPNDSAENE